MWFNPIGLSWDDLLSCNLSCSTPEKIVAHLVSVECTVLLCSGIRKVYLWYVYVTNTSPKGAIITTTVLLTPAFQSSSAGSVATDNTILQPPTNHTKHANLQIEKTHLTILRPSFEERYSEVYNICLCSCFDTWRKEKNFCSTL